MTDSPKSVSSASEYPWLILTGLTGAVFVAWLAAGGPRWEGYPCFSWSAGVGVRIGFFSVLLAVVVYLSYLLMQVTMEPERFTNRAIVLALASYTVLRALVASAMPVLGDEAYHWLWPAHLDWCYYDHGGMTAWIAYPFRLLSKSVLAAHGGPIVLGTITAILTWGFTRWLTDDRRVANIVLAALMVLPIGLIGTTILFTDTPLAVIWVAALWTTLLAIRRDSLKWWLATGVLWGLGLNCKFLAILLIGLTGFYLLFDPQGRRALRTAGPYLALAAAGVTFLPTLLWNAYNGWQTFYFHFVSREPVKGIYVSGLFTYIYRQAVFVGPLLIVWCLLIPPVWAFREFRRGNRPAVLLVLTGYIPLVLYTGLRLFRPAEPGGLNWTAPLFPVLLVPLAWASLRQARARAWLKWSMILGAGTTWVMLIVLVGQAFVGPERIQSSLHAAAMRALTLPGVRSLPARTRAKWADAFSEANLQRNLIVYFGWYPMGRELDGLYERYNRTRPTFVLARTYMQAAQLTQYSRVPLVLSIGYDVIYGRCFDYWNEFEKRKGQDCLFVAEHPLTQRHVDMLARCFRSVRKIPLDERIPFNRMGAVYHVYHCQDMIDYPSATKSEVPPPGPVLADEK